MKNTEKLVVEEIFDAREGKNPDYKTLQVRVSKQVKTFLNTLLNSEGFTQDKVAFQSIHKDVIENLNIQKGDDLGAKIGAELRICHTESLSEGPGFRAMINPTNQEPVMSNGSQIYFKREVADANTEDTFLKRDVSAVAVAASETMSEEEAV